MWSLSPDGMGDATADDGGSILYITCTISYNIDCPRVWMPNTCSQISYPSHLNLWMVGSSPLHDTSALGDTHFGRACPGASFQQDASDASAPRAVQSWAKESEAPEAHPETGHIAGIAGPEMQSSKFQIIIQSSPPRDQSKRTNACRTVSLWRALTLSDLCILLTISPTSTAIQNAPLPLYSCAPDGLAVCPSASDNEARAVIVLD
jgi:hypothetical protein